VVHRLVYRPKAAEDLERIYDWLADWTDPATARGIIDRIERRCEGLRHFPHRGTPHPEVRTNLRTIVEGKAVIAYTVEEQQVQIVHVKYGGQELREENLG
jgi:plasmid stabilization system protein ParE